MCNKKNEIYYNRFIVSLHVTYPFMHDDIVKSSIASKIAQKATHIDTSSSENTKACTIMSTKSTRTTVYNYNDDVRSDTPIGLRPSEMKCSP